MQAAPAALPVLLAPPMAPEPMPTLSATLEGALLARRRLRSPAGARMAVFRYVEGVCDPLRLHSALGDRSPSTTARSKAQPRLQPHSLPSLQPVRSNRANPNPGYEGGVSKLPTNPAGRSGSSSVMRLIFGSFLYMPSTASACSWETQRVLTIRWPGSPTSWITSWSRYPASATMSLPTAIARRSPSSLPASANLNSNIDLTLISRTFVKVVGSCLIELATKLCPEVSRPRQGQSCTGLTPTATPLYCDHPLAGVLNGSACRDAKLRAGRGTG